MTRYSPAPNQSNLNGKIRWDQGVVGALDSDKTNIAVTPTDEGGQPTDIQTVINTLNDLGGGTLLLKNGTYLLEDDIVLPSYVTLQGENPDATIIDFGSAEHQIIYAGENPYTDGTVAATNGSDTITGTGTGWSTEMEGRSIIISGIFFVIVTVNSATELIVEAPFDSPDVTGVSYVIADPLLGTLIKDLTVQNSTHPDGAILFQYTAGGDLEGVTVYDSTIGFNFLDASFSSCEDIVAVGCGTGINVNHAGVWTLTDFGCYSSTGANMVFNRFISVSCSNFTCTSAGGNGITLTNCSNMAVYDMNITTSGGHGIELTTCNYIQMFGAVIQHNTGEGIKLTATADRNIIQSSALNDNGAYGVNIANANCDDNIITSSVFVNNTSGAINDGGTGTIADNNQL